MNGQNRYDIKIGTEVGIEFVITFLIRLDEGIK